MAREPLSLSSLSGVRRSVAVYRRDTRHLSSLTAFMATFVRAGDLVFDIGAHAGDRIAAARAIGARVIAVEPQARMHRLLRLLHGRDGGVILRRACCGAAPGEAVLRVNRANPTVSTLSPDMIDAAAHAPGWHGQVWDAEEPVSVTTLDALSETHGTPDYIKIDVEGHEADVLKGVSRLPPLLSFEVTSIARSAGLSALERTAALGADAFRLSLGESHVWEGPWIDAEAMARRIAALDDADNSGDVYVRSTGI